MGKKKSSSASHQRRPTPAVEKAIGDAIQRAETALNNGEHEKAFEITEESIACHPLSGHLHRVQGMVYQSLAKKASKDSGAKVRHLEDGILSSHFAVDLLPDSTPCAFLLAGLEKQLASCNQELAAGNTVEAVKLEDKEKKDSEEDSDLLVRRKKHFKAIRRLCRAKKQQMIDMSAKKVDGDGNKKEEYKWYWSASLSNENKRGFQHVNIKELEKHLMSLKDQSGVDLLREAIDFAKKNRTLKFWACHDFPKKIGNYSSYKVHLLLEHWRDTKWNLAFDIQRESREFIEMISNFVWKPVDNAATIKMLADRKKSESCNTSDSGWSTKLGECESSSDGGVPGKLSRNDKNDSSKTSVDEPIVVFSDDTEREEILLKIGHKFELLQKKDCLSSSHISWLVEYTKDQFRSKDQMSLFRMHRLESPKVICCLDASQLREVLQFLKDVVCYCGLSEDAELDDTEDDKTSGQLFDERIYFDEDFSCLFWQASQGVPDGIEDDGYDIISPVEPEKDVFSGSYDVVSWLHVGSECEKALESWKSRRDFQRSQAAKLLKLCDEEVVHYSKLYNRHSKMTSKLEATEVVGSRMVEEIKKRERSPMEEENHFLDILKKWQDEIQETDDVSASSELEVIKFVEEETQVLLNDRSGDAAELTDYMTLKEDYDFSLFRKVARQEDFCAIIAIRCLKMQLLKDLSLLRARVSRSSHALEQYRLQLTSVSVYDYRSVIVPMMKSFLQLRLKDMYEDAKKKSEVAEAGLLAEIALEEAKMKKNKNKNKK